MAVPDRIIKEDIALMMNKVLVFAAAALLSGCVGNARHSQCQDIKGEAFGAKLSAAMSGRYLDQVESNIQERRYERCEEMFDLVQYQAQLQQQQAQAQAQIQAQERHKLLEEKSNSPEMKKKLRATSLSDLVNCEKEVNSKSDEHDADVKTMVLHLCEKEIDRRVDAGVVSRDKVNKMLNQADKART